MKLFKRPVFLGLSAIMFIAAAAFIFLANTLSGNDRIYPGVYADDIDLGGMTTAEAKAVLDKKYGDITLELKGGSKNFTVDLDEAGYKPDTQKIADCAFQIGRNGGFMDNFAKAFSHTYLGSEACVNIDKSVPDKIMEGLIDKIAKEVNIPAVNAKLSVSGGGISITDGSDGFVVNKDELKKKINTALNAKTSSTLSIELPLETQKPAVTRDMLCAVNGRIARFTSSLANSGYERRYNVALAASRVSNVLLMPGEKMSFLNTIGDISVNSGYKNSKIIKNNEFVDGIGGGVCQVSSTFYNSALRANLGVVARSNHSLSVGYVPLGLDATIAVGAPDLVLQNNNDFPVYIVNYSDGSSMISEIYGDVNKFKPVEISTKILASYEPATTYVEDPSLPAGREVVDKPGHAGYKVATYITKNGKTSLLNTSVYKKVDKVVKRNSKKAPNAPASVNPSNQAPAPGRQDQTNQGDNPIF